MNPRIANVYDPLFGDDADRYAMRCRRARLGYQAGCERLGLSLWELPPGEQGDYHCHCANEELLVVLSGAATVRTPAGRRELQEGQVMAFQRGAAGAHQVANRSAAELRYLMFSEMRGPEVVVYPDRRMVGAVERMSWPEGGGFAAWLPLDGALEPDRPGPEASSAERELPSLRAPRFEDSGIEGFRSRQARVARQAGAEHLGASLYELPPGQAAWPYHWHCGDEELLVALEGRPALRTPAGWRQLQPGEVVCFPPGPEGAHEFANRTDAPVRVLMVSQMTAPEVAVFPDSGKVAAFERAAGAPSEGQLEAFFRLDDAVGYWAGEQPPPA